MMANGDHDAAAIAAASNATFLLDNKIQRERDRNGIERPKGHTVSWHWNSDVENHHFGMGHPMKPWRLTLTKQIVLSYGMQYAMDSYKSRAAFPGELKDFHKSDYIDFLQTVTPENFPINYPDVQNMGYSSPVFGVGDDCPIFDGLFQYCSLYTGASLDAARKLCNNQADIAVNWSGGLHHAKKSEASGFCYINDIVLAILQLLRHHPRVLYIDIDVHHGDGVEQAFWSTDRVLTVSFHKYDKEMFFPGTGPLDSTGPTHPGNPGAHHSLNIPLNDGIDDVSYGHLFRNVIGPCVQKYNPTAIVLQCGADSLGGDRLGCFNLDVRGHGSCVSYVKTFGIPLLLLGGGGYTSRNVARAWAYETSVCIDADKSISPVLPLHMPFRNAFRKEGDTLFPVLDSSKFVNLNTKEHLDNILVKIREELRTLEGAPSVQMQYIPPDMQGWREEVEEQLKEEENERADEDEDRNGAGGLLARNGRRRKEEERGTIRGETTLGI